MPKSVIVVAFSSPIDDGCDYAVQTMRLLSDQHHVIGLWLHRPYTWKSAIIDLLSGRFRLKTHQDGYTLLRLPYWLPGQRYQVIQDCNLWLSGWLLKICLALQYPNWPKIFWFFEPYQTPPLISAFNSYFKLYDCVDYFTLINKNIQQREEYVFKRADAVAVNSQVLYDSHHRHHQQLFKVPLGFPVEIFKSQTFQHSKSPKVVVGFVGGINYRFDFPLLEKVVKKLPDYTFRFVGLVQTSGDIKTLTAIKRLQALPNTEWLAPVTKDKIPHIINDFDMCLIPYDVTQPFNRNCYPMKLFDYFYLQKPVISTPITELLSLGETVLIGHTAEAFIKHITTVTKKGWPTAIKRRQRQLALNNSWAHKIKMITQQLSALIDV